MKTEYKNQEINKIIPKIKGLYFLWNYDNLKYIGKSVNIRKRLKQHYTFRNNHPSKITHFNFISGNIMFDHELILVNILNPPWNRLGLNNILGKTDGIKEFCKLKHKKEKKMRDKMERDYKKQIRKEGEKIMEGLLE